MNMSDINRSSVPGRNAAPARPVDPVDAVDEAGQWRDLVGAVGTEVAQPLTAALERINTLIATGRIDRASLRALRDEVAQARQAGMVAQQLTRFASGRLRQTHERISLADTVNTVLTHRHHELQTRAITLKPLARPAEVLVDASLAFSLVNALMDWAVLHARSSIEFSIDMASWPAQARLSCRFAVRPADAPADTPAGEVQRTLDSLAWRMVEQTARTMALPLARSVTNGQVTATLEFPRTVNDQLLGENALEGLSSIELDSGFSSTLSTRPLAGSHVLVVASRREMRVRVRDAIRHMGLLVDLVSSLDDAMDFCREGLPDAIIVEGILAGERLRRLRQQVSADAPDLPFINIIEEGNAFQMSGFDGASMGHVGRDAIESALPSVLLFELSRTL